ncbi:carbohydrate kinase family protein [Candidatus Dependentiae bacterium]|nr:carbohydrate kinase family protein [Candidatus Dependentiae bacterium]
MKKILTIGGATQDIFIEYKNSQLMQIQDSHGQRKFLLLEQGAKIEVKHLHYATGGGATNSAEAFLKLGQIVSSIFKVGDDEAGKFIIEKLKKSGINIESVIIAKDQPSGVSFIIPSVNGNRTIFTFRGANSTLNFAEIDNGKKIEQSDCLYITSLTGDSANVLLPVCNLAKKHGALVACNPGTSQLKENVNIFLESLKNIDVLLLNSKEARILMSEFLKSELLKKPDIKKIKESAKYAEKDAPQLLKELLFHQEHCFSVSEFFNIVLSHGPKIIVVTNGSEGVYVATKECMYFHKSLPTKVISTVGAGDAFGSTFISILIDHFDKDFDKICSEKIVGQAIISGLINSASVISAFDAKTGLLNLDQLKSKLNEIGLSDLQKFSY